MQNIHMKFDGLNMLSLHIKYLYFFLPIKINFLNIQTFQYIKKLNLSNLKFKKISKVVRVFLCVNYMYIYLHNGNV